MICTLMNNKRLSLLFFAAISAAAMTVALISQYMYGLHPCVLCIYQRIPYVVVIVLGLAGFALADKRPKTGTAILSLISLTFLANTAIAAYHTGVERKWWASFLEGCTIPEMKGNITDVLAQIQAAPIARCDEIPWTDPVFGLSMANYNVLLCFGLAVLALVVIKPCRKA